MIPAMFDAKFWIPPIDATCRELGAMSPGSDQIPLAADCQAGVGHREEQQRHVHRRRRCGEHDRGSADQPPTITVLRTFVRSRHGSRSR
jgi:hypothetical protein